MVQNPFGLPRFLFLRAFKRLRTISLSFSLALSLLSLSLRVADGEPHRTGPPSRRVYFSSALALTYPLYFLAS
jgi:hypothetical protein